MKSAVIHGVLLAVMLVYGYRTWTRDKTVKPNLGDVVLWTRAEADLVSFEYKNDKFHKQVKLEHRGAGDQAYWWATETTIEKKIKPPEPKKDTGSGSGSAAEGSGSAAGSGSAVAKKDDKKPADKKDAKKADDKAAGSGSAVAKKDDKKADDKAAGSGSAVAKKDDKKADDKKAGSGSAAAAAGSGSGSAAGSGSAVADAGSGSGSAAPPAPVEEEVTKTREYPLGEAGDKLIASYVAARALRDLGTADADMKKKYKLDEAKAALVINFKDGKRSFKVADSQFNDNVRYAVDDSNGHVYVLSKDMFSGFEVGEQTIHLIDPRGFDQAKVESIVLEANGKTKVAARVQSGVEGQQVKTWGEDGKPNQALANYVDNLNTLRPTDYEPKLDPSSLVKVLTATFRDATSGKLGTLTLYKGEKPGELPEGQELDPANPPKGQTVYYIVTEKTHVPGVVQSTTAQRAENDLANIMSDKPVPGDGKSVDPKGNPFGTPLPKPGGAGAPGGAPPANPHGATPPAPPQLTPHKTP
jgi:uncharacterized protein DUF4340